MTNMYKKIVEPVLSINADELRRAAWILENYRPDNDSNLSKEARLSLAEVANRVARIQDFADWLLSDDFEKDLNEEN